jgi:hypothetical protein
MQNRPPYNLANQDAPVTVRTAIQRGAQEAKWHLTMRKCHVEKASIRRVTLPKGIRTPDPQIAASILIRQLPLMTATNAAKAGHNPLILLSGAPEGIRTLDPTLVRLCLPIPPAAKSYLMRR